MSTHPSAVIVPVLIASALTWAPVRNVRQSHWPFDLSFDASRMPAPLMFTAHMFEDALTGNPVSASIGTLLHIVPSSNVSTL